MKILTIKEIVLYLNQNRSRLHLNQSSTYFRGTKPSVSDLGFDSTFSSSRRKFIRLSVLTTGLFVIAKDSIFAGNGTIDVNQVYADALLKFYKRQYLEAEKILAKAIQDVPSSIKLYKLLGKVYSVQHKDAEKALLFEKASTLYTNNYQLKMGLAKSLYQLHNASSREKGKYINSIKNPDILGKSDKICNQLLLEKGTDQSVGALQSKMSKPKRAKNEKKLSKKVDQDHFGRKKTEWLDKRLTKLESQKRRTLFFEDEKQVRKINAHDTQKRILLSIAKKQVRSINNPKYETTLRKICSVAPEVGHIHAELSTLLIKAKRHDDLIQLKSERYKSNKTFTSALGVIKAHLHSFSETGNSKYLISASTQLTALEVSRPNLTNFQFISLATLKVKYLLLAKQFDNAENLLTSLFKREIKDAHTQLMLVQASIKLYQSQGKEEKAQALSLWVLRKDKQPEFPLGKACSFFEIPPKSSIPILHSLMNSYLKFKKLDEAKLIAKEIVLIQPNDKQAQKYV